MKQKLTYRADRDTELWVVVGVEWEIPIRCRYCDYNGVEYIHALPAVPIGFAQSAALEGVMGSLGSEIESVKSGWAVPAENLKSRCRKAEGITPEFYFRWPGATAASVASSETEVKAKEKRPKVDCSTFLKQVAQASGIDESVLTLSWIAITQQIPSWLLSGNSIDLGFIRLVAVPYRKNWKEILLARYPTLKKALMIREPKRLLSMAFTAASRMIRMSELTESHERRGRTVFSWTVEVLHDSSWEKTCDQVEGEAAARLGPLAYVKRWANRVSHIEESIYEILTEQVEKETAPTCRVLWRRGQRGMQFVQASPTLIGSAQIVECDDGGCSSVDDFLGIEDSSAYLEDKASRLLQMSAVQPQDEDVRVPRGDHVSVQPNDGVLVLPPSCSQAAGEAVLDRGDGGQG
jgi:hypothetical protein